MRYILVWGRTDSLSQIFCCHKMGLSLNELATSWNSSSVVLQTDGMREVIWLHDCMGVCRLGLGCLDANE